MGVRSPWLIVCWCLAGLTLTAATTRAAVKKVSYRFLIEIGRDAWGGSMAYGKDFFDDVSVAIYNRTGIDIHTEYSTDSKKSLALMQRGTPDLVQVTNAVYMEALSRKLPYEPVLALELGGKIDSDWCFFTMKDAPRPNGLAGFKGKRIGFRRLDDWVLLRRRLKQAKIKAPPQQYFSSVKVFQDDATVLFALQKGVIDAAIMNAERVALSASSQKELDTIGPAYCFDNFPTYVLLAHPRMDRQHLTLITRQAKRIHEDPAFEIAHAFFHHIQATWTDVDFKHYQPIFAFWEKSKRTGWHKEYRRLAATAH